MPAGDHRREAGWAQGARGNRRRLSGVEGVLAGAAARPESAWLAGWSAASPSAMARWASGPHWRKCFRRRAGQRCWFHKMGNVLNALAEVATGSREADLQAIWMAATRANTYAAFDRFVSIYAAKYPKGDRNAEEGPGEPVGVL